MEVLEDAAVRWRARAGELEDIAAACRAADGVDWQSTAARDFRARLAAAAARIEALAEVARRVAVGYGRHASAIAEVLENIEAFAREADEARQKGEEAIERGNEELTREAKDLLEKTANEWGEAAEAIRRGGEEAAEYLRRNPEVVVAAGGAR